MSNASIYNEGPQIAAGESDMQIDYRGQQGPLFWLGLKNAVLTLLTLGIYRFWAKTRLRKYFWSATAPGGHPLEYTGNGLEKLLGFLIAVAFLAIYLGFFQLLLSFVGMSIFSGGNEQAVALQVAASQATFLLILPFIFYAQYRARRYILSRTRWRGIRFGVEPAAWGYVWRAIGHTLLTILSLGLLAPRATFWLEKYKVDRTWYGNAKFEQTGRWQELYPAMKHVFIALGLLIIPSILAAVTEVWVFFVLTFVGYVWIFYAIVAYQVETFRIMGNRKVLGDKIKFRTAPRTSKVFWTWVLGALLASTCAGLIASAFGIIALSMLGDINQIDRIFEPGNGFTPGAREFTAMALFAIGYLGMILMYGVFALIFVQQPILEHYVQETLIENPEALDEVVQRDRDEMVEAEGFADALDVGAAI